MQNSGTRQTGKVGLVHTTAHTSIANDVTDDTGDVPVERGQSPVQQAQPAMFVPGLLSDQPHLSLASMPAEVGHEIFALACTPLEFETGLLALVKSSGNMRSAVLTFMREDERGKAFSSALRHSSTQGWQNQSRLLIQNARLYLKDFNISLATLFNNVSMKLTGDMACGALKRFKAIEINFNKFDPAHIVEQSALLGEQVASIRDKPVKINAAAFKGSLANLQSGLQVVFANVHVSCPVLLDVSMNAMGDADLRPIVDFLKNKPVIYQLNLDGNPLCQANQSSHALLELVQLRTPISHLYLRHTGFNDAMAKDFSAALAKHACLRHLDLRFNTITEAGAHFLIEAAGKENGVLHVMRLQNNQFQHARNLLVAVNKAQQGRIEASAGSAPTTLLIQLEDMTIFSPDFDPDSLRQQQLLAQSLDSQRL